MAEGRPRVRNSVGRRTVQSSVLVIVTAAIVSVILCVSIGLSIVELRKITPLAFRCAKCSVEWSQPPHLESPPQCPRCRAADWAV